MEYDIDGIASSEESDGLASRSLSGSTAVAFGVALMGGTLAYVVNSLPWLHLNRQDRAYWHTQASAYLCYILIAFFIWIGSRIAERLARKLDIEKQAWRISLGIAVIFVFCGMGIVLAALPTFRAMTSANWENPTSMWFIVSTLGAATYACLSMHRASKEKRERAYRVQLETDVLEVACSQAELLVMEAQIEPHFLFNTLAHIKRQYRISAETADRMLLSLIDYIDRSLPALQRQDWTVGDEFDLVGLYMQILIQRFGDRLRFSATLPDEAKAVRLPALTVTTLVENAVRHGLAPKAGDGIVTLTAEMASDGLRITVSDDGVGLRKASGSGLGLATVRARLRGAFGTAASLVVEPAPSCGVRASITLPLPA
jgi:hypothetical protein